MNTKQRCTVCCYVPTQINSSEAAVGTGVKLKSRGCVKGQQCSVPADAALSSPDWHVSLRKHLHSVVFRSVV